MLKLLRRQKLSKLDGAVLALNAAGLVCLVYSLVEPYQLSTTTVNIYSPKLAEGETLRIVHLTDLHCSGKNRTESKLPDVIKQMQPDMIVFTGDAANNARGYKQFDLLIDKLSKIAPSYAVIGNHDNHPDIDHGQFDAHGFKLLTGTGTTLDVHGIKVFIDGFYGSDRDSYVPLGGHAPGQYSILLNHFPDGLFKATADNFDLFLCGHTHGGQVRLPFYGAVVTESSLGKKYEYGLYHVAHTDIFVSRGIGMTALPIRFLAPPEVALIVVRGVGKQL